MLVDWLLNYVQVFEPNQEPICIHMFQAQSFDTLNHYSTLNKVSIIAFKSMHITTRKICPDRTNYTTKTAVNTLEDELLMEQYSIGFPNHHKPTPWFMKVMKDPEANFVCFIPTEDRPQDFTSKVHLISS
jgi:hypothetical protein